MNMTTEANKKKKRRHLKKKRLWLPITIIVLLIVARLLLPYFVKNYVNKTLSCLPLQPGLPRCLTEVNLRRLGPARLVQVHPMAAMVWES